MGKTKPPKFKDGGFVYKGEFIVPSKYFDEDTLRLKAEYDKAIEEFTSKSGNKILHLQTEEPTFHQLETQQQVFIQNCNNCGANDWIFGTTFSHCSYCRSQVWIESGKPIAIVTSIYKGDIIQPKSINIKN